MIETKKELKEYIIQDALANSRESVKERVYGDEMWKFLVSMRYLDYLSHKKNKGIARFFLWFFHKIRYRNLSIKLGFSIPYDRIQKGFSIAHYGTIVVNGNVIIGQNCRIHEGVTIGATNGSNRAPVIGNNVFISSGAKIIGDISIADDVVIAANAVVVRSISEPGTTWGGIPAKKISNQDSRANLSQLLFTEKCKNDF